MDAIHASTRHQHHDRLTTPVAHSCLSHQAIPNSTMLNAQAVWLLRRQQDGLPRVSIQLQLSQARREEHTGRAGITSWWSSGMSRHARNRAEAASSCGSSSSTGGSGSRSTGSRCYCISSAWLWAFRNPLTCSMHSSHRSFITARRSACRARIASWPKAAFRMRRTWCAGSEWHEGRQL